jgi:hypothetical protein
MKHITTVLCLNGPHLNFNNHPWIIIPEYWVSQPHSHEGKALRTNATFLSVSVHRGFAGYASRPTRQG